METPAAGESGERPALPPVPGEPGQSVDGHGSLLVPISAGRGDRGELELSGYGAALGRVADFLVQSGLVAGGAAVVALLAFVFVWQIFLPFGLALAVGVFFGVSMLLPARNPNQLVADGLTDSELQRALAEGRAVVAQIERGAERVRTPAACARMHSIARTADSILADFTERPQHLPDARFAFDALLNATVMALDRYEKFSRASGPVAQRGREFLEDRVFPTVAGGFQQLLEKLLQDDLRALNVDVVVLEQMLELEGLSADLGGTRERKPAS